MMKPDNLDQLRDLFDSLVSHVKGQDAALKIVAAWGSYWLGGLLERAPRYLFLGPTGVGKTVAASWLAQGLYGRAAVQIDMSEHQLPESLDVLLGSRAGDPGLLRQKLAGQSASVLLLDEIEKAHPRVLDLLLQILEDGRVTTADGVVLDLWNTPIVCTSNLATAAVTDVQDLSSHVLEEHILAQVRRELRPETLNRFDAIVVFRPLDFPAQVEVLRLQLDEYLAWLDSHRNIQILSSAEAERWLMMRGFDQHWGARPLRRAIRFHICQAILDAWIGGQSGRGVLRVDPGHPRLRIPAA